MSQNALNRLAVAVAVLRHENFQVVFAALKPQAQFLGFVAGRVPQVAPEVVRLPVDHQHHVGVVLDVAGLAKIGERGSLVLAAFDAAVELDREHDADPQPLGDVAEAGGISPTS